MIAFVTLMVYLLINIVVGLCTDYYKEFKIEKIYGLSHHTVKSFFIDFLRNELMETISLMIVYCFIIFICENVVHWLHYFQSYSLLIVVMIDLSIFIVLCIISLFSLLLIKKQYHFEDMPDCEIRHDIEAILQGCQKKIHRIMVYDESKKSVSKNAFLLKIPFYREICVADNFMNENSHDELIAVLAHEVGHLRHKKNILNYMSYVIYIVIIIGIDFFIIYPDIIVNMNHLIMTSFQLHNKNYVLSIEIFVMIISIAISFVELFFNYVSRKEEYEADRYAVKLGYGEALIRTFKQISNDELIDVNPAPIVRFQV
jgi:STE24 endopeptidase